MSKINRDRYKKMLRKQRDDAKTFEDILTDKSGRLSRYFFHWKSKSKIRHKLAKP